MPPKRTVPETYTMPGNALAKGKGRAIVIDLVHDDDSSSNNSSREQSALFVTPGPQAGNSHLTSEITERKRASEQIAELQREQKRARTGAASQGQFARQPRPFLEDVEDQTTQPGSEAQATSNAAPSRVVTDSEQGSRNAQSGKPGARAAASVQPANSTVDVVEIGDDDDNDDDDDNGVPPGHLTLLRTNITKPHKEFGREVRSRCYKECDAAAWTLSKRTDEEGKQIYHRCFGTAALLIRAKTLEAVRKIMVDDVKDVLLDANSTLSKRRDKYHRYYKGEDDVVQKLDLKRMLDRQDARVEKVEHAQNFRRDLVNDLRDLSRLDPAIFRENIRTRAGDNE